MNTIDLKQHIQDFITQHMQDIAQPNFDILTPIEWNRYREEYQWRYGWTYPNVSVFCPQIIAKQIEHLDNDNRDHYLQTIMYMYDRWIVWNHDNPDWEEWQVVHAVENEVRDVGPDSLALVSDVEMHALDKEM